MARSARIRPRIAAPLVLVTSLLVANASLAGPADPFPLEAVASAPFPDGLVAAATGSRLAWAFNEAGRRNVYVAEGPEWTSRPVTRYDRDDGQELTSLTLSPDGTRVVYVRGGDHGGSWDEGQPANPAGEAAQVPIQVWSVPFEGGEPVLVGEGDDPAVSPRGDVVAFVKDRQVWIGRIDGSAPAKRLVAVRGASGQLRWSPDGSKLAFVSRRDGHAFVGVTTADGEPVTWMAPGTSRDSSPRWSHDGTRLAFVRRPAPGGAPVPVLERRHQPWSVWTADAATGATSPAQRSTGPASRS